MSDNFEGDPRMFLTADGSDFSYNDGQPIMDSGLENNALISLFTTPGWAGNILLNPANQVGSDFEARARGTITLARLADIKNSADRALSDSQQKVAASVVTVGNKSGNKIDIQIRIAPISDEAEILLSSDAGLNWRNQALNPAYKKV